MANRKKTQSKPPARPAAKKAAVTERVEPEAPTPAARQTWYQKTYRILARIITKSSLPEVLLVATLCYSRYLQNSDFSYPSEVIIDIVLLGVIVSVLFYVFKFALRSRLLGTHIAALLLTYGLYAYTYSFPRFHQWGNKLIPHGASPFTHAILQVLLLAIIFGIIGFAIDALFKLKQLSGVPLLKFLLFVVCFVFAVEMGKVGLRMWTIRKDLSYKQPAVSLQQTGKATSKPDVYYLLFDRYANATTLKNVYDYDNTPLLNDLSSLGFVNRQDAYANYPFTMESISSTLAMNYHTAIGQEFKNDSKNFQTAFPYRQILDNPPVAQALKANGYNYNQVGSWWDFTRNVPAANDNPSDSFRLRMFGKNFWMTDLQRDIINKSILSPLLLKGLTIKHTTVVQYQLDRNPTQNFYTQMNAVKTIAENSATEKQPQFTFAHVLSPHDPYIFDANCQTPTYDPNRTDKGVDETVKYTNQLTCDNKNLEDLVNTIRTKDPGAAIVIQADEGPYPKQFRGTLSPGHYYDPINLPLAQMRQKFGVLASYYMPNTDAQTVSSNIVSSVDAFRFVLDNYLGYSQPMLPDCQFTAGDKYNLYTYQLVSGQLKGTAEPANCKKYQ